MAAKQRLISLRMTSWENSNPSITTLQAYDVAMMMAVVRHPERVMAQITLPSQKHRPSVRRVVADYAQGTNSCPRAAVIWAAIATISPSGPTQLRQNPRLRSPLLWPQWCSSTMAATQRQMPLEMTSWQYTIPPMVTLLAYDVAMMMALARQPDRALAILPTQKHRRCVWRQVADYAQRTNSCPSAAV